MSNSRVYLNKVARGKAAGLWPKVKEGFMGDLPAHVQGEYIAANIVACLHTGAMEMWVSFTWDGEPEGKCEVHAIVLTALYKDPFTGIDNLLIYGVWSPRGGVANLAVWKESIEKFKDYADSLGCQNVVAYTIKDSVAKVAERIGADTTQRILRWEV